MIATAITYYLIYFAAVMALTAAVVTSWCKGYAEGVVLIPFISGNDYFSMQAIKLPNAITADNRLLGDNEYCSGYNQALRDCEKQITSAGYKVE